MNLDVSRVEEKYYLTKLQAEKLFCKLQQVIPGDEFNGNKPYRVRSLYFDSYNNSDYFDKLDGVKVRKKIRLRTYGSDGEIVKLEVKQKNGDNQRKQSLRVTKEEANQLIKGEVEFLLNMNNELAESLYYIFKKEQYRPKCIIEYTRRAFQVPANNIRITFDEEIDISEGILDLFSDNNTFLNPIENRNLVILEVKYNNFLLSYIKDLLEIANVPRESYSKYTKGRYYSLY